MPGSTLPGQLRQRRNLLIGLSTALALALSLYAVPSAAGDPPTITIKVDAAHPGATIPTDFLGLSFEADLMHRNWIDPNASNVDELIGNLGRGNLRFSANQVDRSAWAPTPTSPVPDWANGQIITPEDLSRVGKLARATGWSVDLGVNLGRFNPAAAADQARAAQQRIGSSLRSIQIGNEPNFYILAPVLKSGARRPYIAQTYVPDAKKYRAAIRAAAPGIVIEGPDTVGGAFGNKIIDPSITAATVTPWLNQYVASFGAESEYLNQHYYPFINARRLGFPDVLTSLIGGMPSIDSLLSKENAVKQLTFLRHVAGIAQRGGLKPRLSETNAVAKEGLEGVTNSFGAALWTVDFLLTAATEGMVGANLHNQPGDCENYALICFPDAAAQAAGRATVNPNYYAAMLVARFAGGQLLPTTVEAGAARVSAYAVRMPDGRVQVIVDNMDRAVTGEVAIEITGATGTSASVQRLTAASLEATSGTTFAGATVASDGSFTAGVPEQVPATDGRYRVRLEKPSAILLSLG